MITTKTIQLTKRELFITLLTLHFKRNGWIGALILSIVIFTLFFSTEKGSLEILVIALGFLYPVIIFYQFWIYVNSKDNSIFFRKRFYNMDEDKLTGYLDDKTDNTIFWHQFIKYVELKDRYLLYLSKNQFVDIPDNSFQNESDEQWFRKTVLPKILRK